MLEPDTLTIVAPLKPGTEAATQAFVRSVTDQGWVAGTDRRTVPPAPMVPPSRDTGDRRDAFDFKKLPALHCCAFLVIPTETVASFRPWREDQDLPPCLIVEATFDGPREDFLRDLVDTNGAHLCEVFRHCVGFPAHAAEQPDLLVDFLKRRSIGHNAYFSGVPGRSISEIRSEADLRTFLSDSLKSMFYSVGVTGKPGPRPDARLRDVQRKLRNMVRKRDELNLTEERPSDPVSVRYGSAISYLTGGALLAAFAAVVWCALSFLDMGVADIWRGAETFLLSTQPAFGWLLVLTPIWLLTSAVQFQIAPETRERADRGVFYLMREVVSLVEVSLKLGLVGLWLGLAVAYSRAPNPLNALHWVLELFVWVPACIVLVLVLRQVVHWRAAPLRATENGPHVSPEAQIKKARHLLRVALWNKLRLILLLVLYVPVLKLLDLILQKFGWHVMDWVGWLLVLGGVAAFFGLAGLALLKLFKDTILLLAHALQKIEENYWFAPAASLAERVPRDPDRWAREEHRTHLNQNHFASVALVKSLPRMLLLRLSLTLINFVARYIDNQGKLGGIPTIFSARWVLLDDGHRLVFLTNYVGAWDSYLGEFSDLNAYIGVNAIWTNTYLPLRGRSDAGFGRKCRGIGFPSSSLMLFNGAANEHPFKAYVRESQIETLAWYGAYPEMSVPNINDNSRIRKDLFRTLSTDELDALFRRI